MDGVMVGMLALKYGRLWVPRPCQVKSKIINVED